MAKEIELKCQFKPGDFDALKQHLNSIAQPKGVQLLDNEYYDTADHQLAGARSALRIRRLYPNITDSETDDSSVFDFSADDESLFGDIKPEAAEQTLKTVGHEVDGIWVRQEYNWPLSHADSTLELAHLAHPDISKQLPTTLDLTMLNMLFRTVFVRHQWLIHYQTLHFEIVVDQGRVLGPDISDGSNDVSIINELEIEWLPMQTSGIPMSTVNKTIKDLYQELAVLISLSISHISKAQRGYQLTSNDG